MSFSGYSQGLVEELYAKYLENPKNVEPSWRAYFDRSNGNGAAAPVVARPTDGATIPPIAPFGGAALPPGATLAATSRDTERYGGPERRRTGMSGRVHALITAYRFLGHQAADINPLQPSPRRPKELELATYGLDDGDLTRRFATVDLPGPDEQTLGEIVDRMEETYCRSIGVEFRSIQNTEERHWLQNQMEATKNRLSLDRDEQIHLLRKLIDAENLENFIASSYAPGTKRFSLEGGESLIPLLDMIIESGAEYGIGEMVFGMAHRGRLNVLVNTLETSLREIFYAFEDVDAERYLGRGDVKYHLGFSSDRLTAAGKKVHLTMTFNPSHLEFVNPVVEGRARAKQDRSKDAERTRIAPILIHGDAAFVGQGVNIETLNLTGLGGYTTGGTIHIIVNNQIGFTTDPHDSRSTPYASDILRMLDVPVFHVNGEDPEAVAQVAKLAVSYRQRFHKDVCIDLYCYRRHGHNEGDEPRFTQPAMYEVIDHKPTVQQMYVKRLVSMGQITDEVASEISVKARSRLEEALEEVKRHGFCPVPDTMGGVWTDYRGGWERDAPEVATAVARDTLLRLSETITTLPKDFAAHKKIRTLLKQRHKRVAEDQEFDWGTAEMLAYATLLNDGAPIRLSGEDVRRGTFSHRHCYLVDQDTGEAYTPLRNVNPKARFEAHNSPLSEAGVLGFEFGYSLDSPHMLVIWEAQFGDFLNAAQVIVDQFITSCEDKWSRLSGLTLFLPHGYEGQGPEHSSARIERFLQNAAEDNVQLCNLTTPAQLFHVLRRQVIRSWRKPLVIFTPKSLLRAAFSADGPKPTSRLSDLTEGRFHRILGDDPDAGVAPDKARKVLLCSGKVYYDLAKHRFEQGIDDVAILRFEQLYPFNEELRRELGAYPDGTPLVWVQEEPWNYGPWFYIHAELPRLLVDVLPKSAASLTVVARERSASPATGSKSAHNLEQDRLVQRAFA